MKRVVSLLLLVFLCDYAIAQNEAYTNIDNNFSTNQTVTGQVSATSFTTPGTNTRASIGRAYIGTWFGDQNILMVQHRSLSSATGNYALLQSATGNTYLNAPTGQSVFFRINNATIGTITSAGFNLSSGVYSGNGSGLTNVDATTLDNLDSDDFGRNTVAFTDLNAIGEKATFFRSGQFPANGNGMDWVSGVQVTYAGNLDYKQQLIFRGDGFYRRSQINGTWEPMYRVLDAENLNLHVNKAYIDGLDIDADLVDGLNGDQLARTDASETFDLNLTVKGTVETKKLRVTINPGVVPDYVFKPGYQMPTLTELEKYIKANAHLPKIPNTTEMSAQGQDVGRLQLQLLEKIEELTLYLIEQNKKVAQLEKMLQEQSVVIESLKKK